MATLEEIRRDLFNDKGFNNRLESAGIIAAVEMLQVGATDAQKALAEKVFNDPKGYGKKNLYAIVGINRAKTVEEILGLADEVLIEQTKGAALLFAGA